MLITMAKCSASPRQAGIYEPPPKPSCLEIASAGGASGDGIYTIAPPGFEDGFEVWCSMTGSYPGATLAIRKGDMNGSCPSSFCGAPFQIECSTFHSYGLDAHSC